MRSNVRAAAVALVVATLLTGCAPTTWNQRATDTAALEDQVAALDGVARATVGIASTGTPGSYLLATSLFTDGSDIDARSLIIETARIIQPAAPDLNRYTFEVGADPDPGEPVDFLPLRDLQDQIDLPGEYRSSTLSVSATDLAEIANTAD